MVNQPTSETITSFRKRLLSWGRANARTYPWRWTNDAYLVLVAELMLHRTQAKQVVPIYMQWVTYYPSLDAFSRSDAEVAQGILKSLGLQWRIDSMLVALTQLWWEYRGIPLDQNRLTAVRGIGPYIAGATVCFAANVSVTLVDTNTVRVIGRVWGLDLSGEARRRKTIVDAIALACDPVSPRDYYYALIDFAHSICTPNNPDCLNCPLLDLPCQYGNTHISNGGQECHIDLH